MTPYVGTVMNLSAVPVGHRVQLAASDPSGDGGRCGVVTEHLAIGEGRSTTFVRWDGVTVAARHRSTDEVLVVDLGADEFDLNGEAPPAPAKVGAELVDEIGPVAAVLGFLSALGSARAAEPDLNRAGDHVLIQECGCDDVRERGREHEGLIGEVVGYEDPLTMVQLDGGRECYAAHIVRPEDVGSPAVVELGSVQPGHTFEVAEGPLSGARGVVRRQDLDGQARVTWTASDLVDAGDDIATRGLQVLDLDPLGTRTVRPRRRPGYRCRAGAPVAGSAAPSRTHLDAVRRALDLATVLLASPLIDPAEPPSVHLTWYELGLNFHYLPLARVQTFAESYGLTSYRVHEPDEDDRAQHWWSGDLLGVSVRVTGWSTAEPAGAEVQP